MARRNKDVAVKVDTTKVTAHVDPVATTEKAAAPAPLVAAVASSAAALDTSAAISTSGAWVPPNYDAMSVATFKALLAAEPMAAAMARKSEYDAVVAAAESETAREVIEGFTDGEAGGFSYAEMLSSLMQAIRKIGVDASKVVSASIPTPQLEPYGTKRTILVNFFAIAEAINRTNADLQDFFNKHLTIESSIDSNGALIMKMQRVHARQIETTIGKYVDEYVMCHVCRSLQTSITKDSEKRMFLLSCLKCGATRYVSMPQAAGYKAQTTKRSALKAKQTTL